MTNLDVNLIAPTDHRWKMLDTLYSVNGTLLAQTLVHETLRYLIMRHRHFKTTWVKGYSSPLFQTRIMATELPKIFGRNPVFYLFFYRPCSGVVQDSNWIRSLQLTFRKPLHIFQKTNIVNFKGPTLEKSLSFPETYQRRSRFIDALSVCRIVRKK